MFSQRFLLSVTIIISLLSQISFCDSHVEYVYMTVEIEDKSMSHGYSHSHSYSHSSSTDTTDTDTDTDTTDDEENTSESNAITACEDTYASALQSIVANLLYLSEDSITVTCIHPMDPTSDEYESSVKAIIAIELSTAEEGNEYTMDGEASVHEVISYILSYEHGSSEEDAINEFSKKLSKYLKYNLYNNSIKIKIISIDTRQLDSIYGMVSLNTKGDGYENVNGNIYFEENRQLNLMTIRYNITGLTTGNHGFHIHTYGDLREGCISTGGHYNPFGFNHGSPNDIYRHIGDLGNIIADDDGNAYGVIYDQLITFVGDYNVAGRAIVVHAGEDDLGQGGDDGSLATGNAGGRVACGVISIVASF